ncbi:MAG TPA: HAD family phosphatase, partial [Polyangiaceae bacterium]|nr:HAD family phosphatase [Polyangiaceae bacterium]
TGDGFRELTLRDPEGNLVELCSRVAPEPHYGVRAVLFDLDGTLIDSEENYYRADCQLLARRGIEFRESDKRRYIGGSNLDMMVDLVRRFGFPETPSALVAEKNELYMEIARQQTRPYPEMKRFWNLIRGRGIPVGVVSGSSPAVIHELLTVVGLADQAQVIVSAEEVERGKPAPDAFLEAAQRLGVSPEHCVVVEDSRYGVEAARRAFMRCIAVPYLHDEPLDEAFGFADLLFARGMEDFDADLAMKWVDAESGDDKSG